MLAGLLGRLVKRLTMETLLWATSYAGWSELELTCATLRGRPLTLRGSLASLTAPQGIRTMWQIIPQTGGGHCATKR